MDSVVVPVKRNEILKMQLIWGQKGNLIKSNRSGFDFRKLVTVNLQCGGVK